MNQKCFLSLSVKKTVLFVNPQLTIYQWLRGVTQGRCRARNAVQDRSNCRHELSHVKIHRSGKIVMEMGILRNILLETLPKNAATRITVDYTRTENHRCASIFHGTSSQYVDIVTHKSGNTLDVFLCNFQVSVSIESEFCDHSDHALLHFTLSTQHLLPVDGMMRNSRSRLVLSPERLEYLKLDLSTKLFSFQDATTDLFYSQNWFQNLHQNIAGLYEKQKIISPVFTKLFLVTYDSPNELLFNLDAKGVCQIKVPRD